MRLAYAALHALSASHVHLRADLVAFFYSRDAAARAGHYAGKLMARNQRRMNASLRPRVPVEDVQVGSADACSLHAHQHLAGAGSRDRNLAQFNAGRGVSFYNGLHGGGHTRGTLLTAANFQSSNRFQI